MGCVCMLGDSDKPTPTRWEETGEGVGRRRRKGEEEEEAVWRDECPPAPEALETEQHRCGDLALGSWAPQQSPP